MNLDKYTQKAQEAVLKAQEIAQELSQQSVEPAHLLLALLQQDEGVVPAVVTSVAGSPAALRDEHGARLDLNGPRPGTRSRSKHSAGDGWLRLCRRGRRRAGQLGASWDASTLNPKPIPRRLHPCTASEACS